MRLSAGHFAFIVLCACATAHAQSGGGYVNRKGAIDGGGLTFHTGGGYRMGGTVGQHDAVVLSGGNYVLHGGFWTPGMMAEVPDPLMPDPSGINKSRFISFILPSSATSPYAIRVLLSSMHHVSPPYTGGPTVPFTSFEGQARWVGPPAQYEESTSTGTPFFAASLQCAPYYQNWNTVGLLHVTGSAIVPSSVYGAEMVATACQGAETAPACVTGGSLASPQLQVKTGRWCDVVIPFNPPSTTAQPDLSDVGVLVNKFRSAPGAPTKARALLAGEDAFGNLSSNTISADFSFTHIAACVDAFRGKPYPYAIQACP